MGDAGHANASDALRAELATLRARALRKRAEAAPGVTEEQMDGAEDAADPTAALIELIVKAELPGSEMSPDSLRAVFLIRFLFMIYVVLQICDAGCYYLMFKIIWSIVEL